MQDILENFRKKNRETVRQKTYVALSYDMGIALLV
jgi:hypothetical protein